MVDFGNILKQLRTQSCLTQKQLAEKIGVTKSVISYYELQERTPSPDVIIKLAEIFHVTTDYLLGINTKSEKTLDITGLKDDDIELLNNIIATIRKKNIQLDILQQQNNK